ncbi:MAG TPA: DUF1345 domain-containing protein [Candidatus Microsaccharimonas sp.]|jgi:uncharacterized membrane protein
MSTIKKINSSSTIRLLTALIIGIIVAVIGFLNHFGNVSILIGWEVAVIIFVVWIWFIIWPMGHERTSAFAQREDPGRVGVDILLILASLASLGAVGYALFEAHTTSDNSRQLLLTVISLFSVVVSWVLIHTIYALRYARFYFSKEIDGTIDFKKDHKPAYSDFIYVAFTIGMTFQVSDTDLIGTEFRKTVLRHAILSYVFGTVIVATTISLIAGLGK